MHKGLARALFALGTSTVLGATQLAAQEPKVITSWDIQTTSSASKLLGDAAARFEKGNPGYKVDMAHIMNDAYKAKLKIAFGANQPPCVFTSWGGGPLHEYIKAGQVVDLTPHLAGAPAYRDRFAKAGFKSVSFDGKVYGIPAENTAVAVVYYNKEVFAKYKLTPPKTWDELMNVVKVLKANNVAPFALANKNKWPGSMYYVYLVDRIGGSDVFRKAAQRAPGGSFTDPAFVEAGKKIQELVKAGAFAQGYNGLDYDIGASRRLMYSGKAAMELMGTWEAATIRSENPSFYEKLDFFPFPTVAGGKGDATALVGNVGDNFFSVSSACKDPDAAFKLIQSLTDDPSIQARLDDKRLPPVKGLKITDPYLQRVLDLATKASSVQLWYDQELPPKMAELHKDTIQAVFGLSMTPEDAAKQMEAAAKTELR
ncbi:extracellular solute-binding protein [Niveibacterium sp. SC-1]|uniref:extracellular solute-binding protein n=1 Tax=Niveibacterium sp. SC-1 TaxID=3135646 RepID=UPI00311FD671